MSITVERRLHQLVTSPRRRWAAASFLVVVAAQIALPLAPDEAFALVTVTVIFLTVATFLIAMATTRPKQIVVLGLALFAVSLVIESLGQRSGLPFGDYSYGSELRPQLGGVPLIVPLAWIAMGLPSWEIGRSLSRSPVLRALAGGWALMAWDLFLDPLMTNYGFWIWVRSGPAWQGIPIVNFLGWFVAGTLLCALTGRFLESEVPNNGLVALYLWMVGFSAIGFVLPFAFDRPAVAAVGTAVSAPLVALSLKRHRWLAS